MRGKCAAGGVRASAGANMRIRLSHTHTQAHPLCALNTASTPLSLSHTQAPRVCLALAPTLCALNTASTSAARRESANSEATPSRICPMRREASSSPVCARGRERVCACARVHRACVHGARESGLGGEGRVRTPSTPPPHASQPAGRRAHLPASCAADQSWRAPSPTPRRGWRRPRRLLW